MMSAALAAGCLPLGQTSSSQREQFGSTDTAEYVALNTVFSENPRLTGAVFYSDLSMHFMKCLMHEKYHCNECCIPLKYVI